MELDRSKLRMITKGITAQRAFELLDYCKRSPLAPASPCMSASNLFSQDSMWVLGGELGTDTSEQGFVQVIGDDICADSITCMHSIHSLTRSR